MNNLNALQGLRNTYHAMRHGRSRANEEGIIVSWPEHGVGGYGLSRSGKRQVLDSIRRATQLDARTEIISSDFLRAQETAELVHEVLGCSVGIRWEARLRERNFGDLELGADDQYPKVWERDRQDPSHGFAQVESPESVMDRTTALIAELESNRSDAVFLLVSHGDPLQILRAAFHRLPASLHRSLPPIVTAQIDRLTMEPMAEDG